MSPPWPDSSWNFCPHKAKGFNRHSMWCIEQYCTEAVDMYGCLTGQTSALQTRTRTVSTFKQTWLRLQTKLHAYILTKPLMIMMAESKAVRKCSHMLVHMPPGLRAASQCPCTLCIEDGVMRKPTLPA